MNTKKTYQNVEELAADLAFIAWVKSGDPSPKGDWHSHLKAQGDLDFVVPAQELVKAFSFSDYEVTTERKDQIWDFIEAHTGNQTAKVRFLTPRRLSIAASLLLLVGAFWWISLRDPLTTAATGLAEVTQIELPDGSKIDLNAKSSIEYSRENWEDKRELALKGEAFFEVAKGEKFTVSTENGQVEVLGTSFNVVDRNETFSVVCHSGKVRVTSNDQVVLLSQNESAQLSGSKLIKSATQVDPSKTWMKGYFVYQEAKLEYVLDEIERQFAVDIDRSQINQDKRYTGFFIKNNLPEALQAVCWPMRLKFDISGQDVKISEDK